MSYYLADATGPLEDFASIGGLAAFGEWAKGTRDPLKAFARRGFTEDLTGLVEVLSQATAPTSVQEQVNVLLACAKRAQDVLIVSDGMSKVEARELSAHKESELHTAADKHVKTFKVAVQYAFAMGRAAVADALQKGVAPDPDVIGNVVSRELEETIKPATILKVMEAGGNVALSKLLKLKHLEGFRSAANDEFMDFGFDTLDENAIEWALQHAAEMVKGISETSRDQIRAAVAKALETGDLKESYDEILAAVGDDDRAELIARHETMTAASEGQRTSWDQAVEEGLLTGDEKRAWIATEGGCDECMDLDGETTGLDENYPGDGGDGPPLHVRCRCTEGIVG